MLKPWKNSGFRKRIISKEILVFREEIDTQISFVFLKVIVWAILS